MSKGRAEAVRLVPLADCAAVLPGFSIHGGLKHDPHATHQVVRTRHLTEGVPYSYRDEDEFKIAPGRETANYELRAGDVLFMSRGTRNLAWVVKDVPDPSIAPVSFYILRPAGGIDSRYLAWYLNQPPVQAGIDQIRTGAGTPIVQRNGFERLEVVLPPVAVQREIADLSELMARERDLRRRLGDAAERAQAAIGRQIIEKLSAGAGAGAKRS
ncbi:MAG TPA: restriction endonuclease subunit S [Gemmatimonadales bacterium]